MADRKWKDSSSFRNVDCVLLLNYINAGLEIYAQSSGLAVKLRYFRCFASVCLKGRSFGHKRWRQRASWEELCVLGAD